MTIKTAVDAFSHAINEGYKSGKFQMWIEKGLANENGKFQDGALGRIIKEGTSEFKSAFARNLGRFNEVLDARRQQVNTLTDQRGFVETTKSEIKEGVDSVKEGVKKAGSIVKAGTENLIGGIKKKINDLNTKSKVQPEGEIKAGSAGSESKINESNSSQTFSNFNRKLLQNQNRIDPSKIVEFEKKTGQKYGDYMLERGRVGGPEENVGKMTEYINTLKEQKRQAFEKMSGTAQSEAIRTLLTDIVERATQVRDPDAKKFTTMLAKHSEGGISFPELEEAKRRYEKNIKTGYYKDNNSVGIQRATNLDTEIRKYQQEEAIKQGFTNIKELNKEISNAYFLSNEIMRKQLKMDANNQVSLTDYLMLGAMPDNVGGFAGLALKIAMKNKSVKNAMLHAVARLFGNHKNSKEIKVDLEKIEKMADQKSVADAIERFMKKWNIEEPKALPKTASATVVGKNGPQVKNPLTPEPMRRKVVEIDRRPKGGNVLGDTIARNAKPVNKRDENAVGLKTTKKTGNSKQSEYTSTEKSSSITSPGNIRAESIDSVAKPPIATTFSLGTKSITLNGKKFYHQHSGSSFKTKHTFNPTKDTAGFVENFNTALQKGENFALIGKYKGNDVKIYFNNNFANHFIKHGGFKAENLVETINNYDAVNIGSKNRYVFEKELPNGRRLRAITTKNFSEITFFETKNKFKGGEVIEKGLGNLREGAETRATKLEQKFQRVVNNYKDQVKKVREKWDSLEKAKGDVEIEDSYGNIYHSIREIDNKIDDLKTESYRYNKDNWTASDRAEWSESYDDFLNDLNTDMDMFESLKSHYEGEVKRLSDEVIDNMPIEVRDLLTNNKRTGGAAWEQAIQAYVDGDAKSFDSMMKNIEGANYRHNNTSYDEIRQKEASGLSEEAYKEYRKEFNTDVETDYGWLITGEEPAYQRVNGNPKYGVADATEKTITPERAKELKNIRNGKSVEEIANDYGVAIEIADKITTPEGIRAYGKYGDGVITLAEKIKEGTAPHELFHATFDIVDHARKETILEGVMKEKKLDKVQAEEFLADNFSEYFRTGRMKGEKVVGNVGKPLGKKLYDAVKDFFKQVKDWITGVSKNKKQVKQLFDDILDGEVEKGNIYLKTPDGKVYQQAGNIYSNNFKKWFGDWEKGEGSKVVDSKGEPMLMYHGSPEKFTIFDSDFMSQHGSSKGYGFYFSPDKKMAEGYGDVMTVYLDIKNPLSKDKLSISRKEMKNLILDVEKNIAEKWGSEDGTLLDNFGDTRRYGRDRVLEDAIDMLMENENDVDVFGELKNIGGDYDSVAKSFRKILGKDGIITPKEYIVFESNQIKSATDNVGTFDSNNPDIRYQLDGKVKEIGEGEFGKIYEGVKGADAEQFLIQQKGGEVRGAYSYKNEPVDLIRGEFDGKKGYGLKKIAEKHPEVIGKIQDLLDTLPLMELRGERIILGNNTSKVVLSLNRKGEEKRWIVTAFDLKK
ncbi:MAG: hypothetical protein ACFNWZ_02215 [Candidatus Absconditicoccaceae bacterium]